MKRRSMIGSRMAVGNHIDPVITFVAPACGAAMIAASNNGTASDTQRTVGIMFAQEHYRSFFIKN